MDPPRKPGRPKGSKNKADAGNVGRPRKDGQPPKKKTGHVPDQSTRGASESNGTCSSSAFGDITSTQDRAPNEGHRVRHSISALSATADSRHAHNAVTSGHVAASAATVPRQHNLNNTVQGASTTSSALTKAGVLRQRTLDFFSRNVTSPALPTNGPLHNDTTTGAAATQEFTQSAHPADRHSRSPSTSTSDMMAIRLLASPSQQHRCPSDSPIPSFTQSSPLSLSPLSSLPALSCPPSPPFLPSPCSSPFQSDAASPSSAQLPCSSPSQIALLPPLSLPPPFASSLSSLPMDPSDNQPVPVPTSLSSLRLSPLALLLPVVPAADHVGPSALASEEQSLVYSPVNKPLGTAVAACDLTDRVENPYGSDLLYGGGNGEEEDDNGETGDGEIRDIEDVESELDEEFCLTGDDDEPAANATSLTLSSLKKPVNRPSTMPIWLDNEYKGIREKLALEIDRRGVPMCYERNSFYDGMTNPFLAGRLVHQIEPGIFHQPEFFVWLPHLLVAGIPCPACESNSCRTILQRNGWVDKPRWAVDIDHNVFIIGYRYHCGNQDCRCNYRSWSPAMLDILPRAISAQFPFHLTYQSGLSDRLVALLQESFRAGNGPVRFTQMIRSFHYRCFDQFWLQFLEMVQDRKQGTQACLLAKMTPFGDFSDRDGYAGFVPTAPYFARFYDALIEKSKPEMLQALAMISARLLALDHSFKTNKRMGKANGVPAFSTLHTTTNDYGEIRAMTLTPTKAHNQFMPILSVIPNSLRMFGHDPIEAVFTDNVRGDKHELEQVFPSLLQDVVPVATQSDLPHLELPGKWNIVHLSSTYQVNLRFNIIMHQSHEDYPIVAAFDMEWPVNRETGISGHVALIQIVYEKTVYLIQTSHFLQDGQIHLPSALLTFLSSSAYKKVGVGIGADFKRLQRDCGYQGDSPAFTGHVELGAMAKDCNAATRKNVSLVELSATVLWKHLHKDPVIRVSTHWADTHLQPAFIDYAALDVAAVWLIYEKLNSLETSSPVTLETAGGSIRKLGRSWYFQIGLTIT